MSLDSEELALFSNSISNDLIKLTESSSCCKTFHTIASEDLRNIVHKLAKANGLRSRIHYEDTVPKITVYKKECPTYADLNLGHLKLCESSQLLIQNFLKKCPINEGDQMKMSTHFYCPNDLKPVVQHVKFLRKLDDSVAILNFDPTKMQPKPIDVHKQTIISAVAANRVTIFRSRSHVGKSRRIPQFLMESYNEHKIGCKIVSTQIHEICVFNNYQFLSSEINHMLIPFGIYPQLVGYQIPLMNNASNSTRIIYTTTKFFLRSLMGPDGFGLLRKITHLIIDEVQENDAFILMLLNELKEIFNLYLSLKLILISSNEKQNCSHFADLFGKAVIIDLKFNFPNNVEFFDIERIYQIIGAPTETANPCYKELMQPTIDITLETYYENGDSLTFDYFLYLVDGENVGIDVKHSITYVTALMGAVKNDNFEHLMALVKRNANCILNESVMNQLERECIISGKYVCFRYIVNIQNHDTGATKFLNYRKNQLRCHKTGVDFTILTKLIIYLTEEPKKDILVFLPSYEDLLKLKYRLLKEEILNSFGCDVEVHLLYPNLHFYELQAIYNTNNNERVKIILATEIAECLIGLNNITAVIDTGLKWQEYNIANTDEKDIRLEWISKEKAQLRQLIVGNKPIGFYFYLFTNQEYQTFGDVENTIVDRMNLDVVALYGKILRPFISTAEYLNQLSFNIPQNNVKNTIEKLKAMDIFNKIEDVTWLGVHLIDIPLKLSSAKMLIYATFLQCVDPILTIISFLEYHNVFEIPQLKTSLGEEFRFRIKNQLTNISEGFYSDHFIYIHLYNNWRNYTRMYGNSQGNNCYPLVDEKNFIVNELMKNVDKLRFDIVSSNCLMKFLSENRKSNYNMNQNACHWAVVKACISCGSYPNICQIDSNRNGIRSRQHPQVYIHPTSVIRNLDVTSLGADSKKYPSKWVVYSRVKGAGRMLQINTCSLITPLSIAMLCGTTQINQYNIVKANTLELINKFPNSNGRSIIFIDNWIELIANATDTNLIMLLRLWFYNVFLQVLKNCNISTKTGSYNENMLECVNLMSKLLVENEAELGFKNLPTNCVYTIVPFIWVVPLVDNTLQIPDFFSRRIHGARHRRRSFHILVVPFRKLANQIVSPQGLIKQNFLKLQAKVFEAFKENPNQDIFIFVYSVDDNSFLSANKAIRRCNSISLLECFRNNVTSEYFEYICTKHQIFASFISDSFQGNTNLNEQLGNDLLEKMANTEHFFFK